MKETIERLQILADRANKYKYPKDSNMGVRISDIDAVLEFYERHNPKSEPLPNVPDITPEWGKIPDTYDWVAIDADGVEFAFYGVTAPKERKNYPGEWLGEKWYHKPFRTGREFNMAHIDWTKTLSKRPEK